MFPKPLKLVCTLCVLLAASGTYAADGTITFTGSITANTCKVTTNNGNLNINLPALSTSSFSNNSLVAGSTKFTLGISGCGTGVTNVSAYFEQNASDVDFSTGYLRNKAANAASDIQIALYNASGVPMKLLGDSADTQLSTVKQVVNGSALLDYSAGYISLTGNPQAGDVLSSIVYTLIYP